MTTISPELEEKIERRAKRAWRRRSGGASKPITRISDVSDTELNYRLPYTPDYYGKEKIRVVKHNDGRIEVDPKTTGLLDCKTLSDFDKLKKHGDLVRAYVVTKKDAKEGGKVFKVGKDLRLKFDVRTENRVQCLGRVNPGDRVFVVEFYADDIIKTGHGYVEINRLAVVDELDQEKDLGFTDGLIDCQSKADLDKLKKHIGDIRAYVLKKRPKKSLPLNKRHTLKTGERYSSREDVANRARPGDKVYVAEFGYGEIVKHHTDGLTAAGRIVEELDLVKDLGFTVGTMLDMLKNSDIKKLAKHDGMVRGYKYVTKDLKSPTQTGPEQITYKVGDEFEIPNADTNPRETCGKGINIATQEWCKGFAKPPKRALAFEFHSKDVAAIPTDGGKMRVFRCLCVEEVDIKTFKPLAPKTPKKVTKKKVTKKKGFFGRLMGSEDEEG
jgi:hypothetical protein